MKQWVRNMRTGRTRITINYCLRKIQNKTRIFSQEELGKIKRSNAVLCWWYVEVLCASKTYYLKHSSYIIFASFFFFVRYGHGCWNCCADSFTSWAVATGASENWRTTKLKLGRHRTMKPYKWVSSVWLYPEDAVGIDRMNETIY